MSAKLYCYEIATIDGALVVGACRTKKAALAECNEYIAAGDAVTAAVGRDGQLVWSWAA
jgi:hypothetical protein